MKNTLDSVGQRVLRKLGFELVRYPRRYKDLDALSKEIYEAVHSFTMTSSQRVYALVNAVKYVVRHDVPGDLVECGVWKGGSSMAIAMALKALGSEERRLFLYDTFSGMSAPTDFDITVSGRSPEHELGKSDVVRKAPDMLTSPVGEVRDNLLSTGYPEAKLNFIQGRVEDTIPNVIPEKIALLRLDTDWYESTYHELLHLFPRLSERGVLIIDDYGYWQGARKAVDQYIEENDIRLLLNRIDHAGRIAVKQT